MSHDAQVVFPRGVGMVVSPKAPNLSMRDASPLLLAEQILRHEWEIKTRAFKQPMAIL